MAPQTTTGVGRVPMIRSMASMPPLAGVEVEQDGARLVLDDRGLGVRRGADLGGDDEAWGGQQAAQRAGPVAAVADHDDDQRRRGLAGARHGRARVLSGHRHRRRPPPSAARGQARERGALDLSVVRPGAALEAGGRARIARSCRRRRCTPRSWTGTPSTRATCPGAPPAPRPWAVLVSEVMLQQTPVARVEPVYRAWLERWPTPAALAAEPPGEAVRAWGRLGYPRRALRLHAAATEVVARHGGELPTTYDELLDAARRRRVHRCGGGVVRARRPARRAGHQRAPGAGPGGRRRRAAGAHAHGRRAGARRGGRAGRPGNRGPLGGRRDGARRAGLHGPGAGLRHGARSRTGARGGWRAPRRTTGRCGAPRPSPAPTGRCAGC